MPSLSKLRVTDLVLQALEMIKLAMSYVIIQIASEKDLNEYFIDD